MTHKTSLLHFLSICLFALSIFGITGCASSGIAIEEVMLPLSSIHSSLANNLPSGIHKESLNGRELTSGYFAPSNFDQDATEARERAYAFITVLGTTRPYRVTVRVYREHREKTGTPYKKLGTDSKLAEILVERLKLALADRREDRNVIDDFRAF